MGTSMEPYGPDANNEINSARSAADDALEHLRAAQSELDKAQNWGFVDMMGGGMFSSLIKQSKMQNANREIKAAKQALLRFAETLQHVDVDADAGLHIELNDFWSVTDIMFDNFFADMVVQQRIEEARIQIAQAIEQVELVRSRLW